MSAEEKFVLWEHVRKHRIKRAKLPNDGLKWYALNRGIATEDDVVTHEGDYGEFEGLRPRKYHEAIDNLVDEYNFEIIRDIERDEDDDEDNIESENGDNLSEYEVSPKEGADYPGVVSMDEVVDDEERAKEVMEGDGEQDQDSSDSEEDDELTRFRTYEEPDLDDDEKDDFDVDRDAVKQFVDEFCNVDPEVGEELKVHKSQLFSAFDSWAKINGISLDELSEDHWINKRKGNLNSIIEENYDVNEGRYTINGDRKPSYDCIELSGIGEKLIQMG